MRMYLWEFSGETVVCTYGSGAVDTTAALRRLVQSAAIRRVAGTWIIPTTDKDHETLATNLGRLQIKQESHALLPSNVHVLKLILTQDILRSCY